MIANSGRFKHSLKLVLAEQPFENFMALTDWLFKQAGATHKIALDRLANLVTRYLVEQRGMDKHEVQVMIGKDYAGDARHVQSPELMQDKEKSTSRRSDEKCIDYTQSFAKTTSAPYGSRKY